MKIFAIYSICFAGSALACGGRGSTDHSPTTSTTSPVTTTIPATTTPATTTTTKIKQQYNGTIVYDSTQNHISGVLNTRISKFHHFE